MSFELWYPSYSLLKSDDSIRKQLNSSLYLLYIYKVYELALIFYSYIPKETYACIYFTFTMFMKLLPIVLISYSPKEIYGAHP